MTLDSASEPARPAPAGGEPVDVGLVAHRAAEAHLAAVWAAEDAAENAEEGDEVEESPAFGPWDGCDTCVVREVLAAAWPVFEEHVLTVLRDAGHPDAAALLAATFDPS